MLTILHWICIAMVFYAVGEYYAKQYGNTSNIWFAIISWIGYGINALCFFPAISRLNSLTILGTMWNISYVIITLFIGLIVFKEPLTSIQMVGLCFAFVAVVLLSI